MSDNQKIHIPQEWEKHKAGDIIHVDPYPLYWDDGRPDKGYWSNVPYRDSMPYIRKSIHDEQVAELKGLVKEMALCHQGLADEWRISGGESLWIPVEQIEHIESLCQRFEELVKEDR